MFVNDVLFKIEFIFSVCLGGGGCEPGSGPVLTNQSSYVLMWAEPLFEVRFSFEQTLE